MRGYRLWLVIILAVAAVSIWISLPDTSRIDFLGIKRDVKVVQGLDLQGGSRVCSRYHQASKPIPTPSIRLSTMWNAA